MNKLKMYILVKEDLSIGLALTSVAHASLAAYLKFQDSSEVKEWLAGPFYKVICKVNEKEFENAKTCAEYVCLTEATLNDREVVLAFKPRSEYPKMFRFFRLYK